MFVQMDGLAYLEGLPTKKRKKSGTSGKTKDIPFAVAENVDNLSHNWVYRSVSLVCPVYLGCRMADDWRRHMTKITASRTSWICFRRGLDRQTCVEFFNFDLNKKKLKNKAIQTQNNDYGDSDGNNAATPNCMLHLFVQLSMPFVCVCVYVGGRVRMPYVLAKLIAICFQAGRQLMRLNNAQRIRH